MRGRRKGGVTHTEWRKKVCEVTCSHHRGTRVYTPLLLCTVYLYIVCPPPHFPVSSSFAICMDIVITL
jgi:hypothetical protein